MGDARRIVVGECSRAEADALVRAHHYSGKPRSQSRLHLGVWLDGVLLGAMQWGPPLDQRMIVGLVDGTRWDGVVELHRMAFSPALPRNSESRALGMVLRAMRRHAPWIEWALSYADGARSGSGVIYRASGWLLTGATKGATFWRLPDGRAVSTFGLRGPGASRRGTSTTAELRAQGAAPIVSTMYRYVYPLQPGVRERLTVPVLDYARARC